MSLPETMRAIVLASPGDSSLTNDHPFPSPVPGSVTIRVTHSLIHPNAIKIFTSPSTNSAAGAMPLPYPLVPGAYTVGRVVATGQDTTSFKVDDLVVVEPFILARDDKQVRIMLGAFEGFMPAQKALARNAWRDGCWAEYARVPLENTWKINESLLPALGIKAPDLCYIGPLSVVYAGLAKIGAKAGETIVITPATGVFTGAAVHVARAMGINVIAAGRNADKLASLAKQYPGLTTAVITGEDAEKDTKSLTAASNGHTIDAVVDISPAEASNTGYIAPLLNVLGTNGRACLMGGRMDASIPQSYIMGVLKDVTIRFSWMYEPEHVQAVIKMVESGVLKLGEANGMGVGGEFKLEEYMEGMKKAAEESKPGKIFVLSP